MLLIGLQAVFGLSVLVPWTLAQFPLTPEGVTILESKFGDGVKISYKEVTSNPMKMPDT